MTVSLFPIVAAALLSQAEASPATAGPVASPAMIEELELLDAALFEAAFETCDVELVDRLIADDLEFYHDKDGLSYTSDEAFLEELNCLSQGEGDPRFVRRLVPGTLETFQMGDTHALQTGRHNFYQLMDDGPDIFRETARFTSLWRRAGESWELVRVISYDHRLPEE